MLHLPALPGSPLGRSSLEAIEERVLADARVLAEAGFDAAILENYGEQLTIRDLGLLKVAVELNLARLEEIPRQIAEAHERRRAHEAAREAWRRDQLEFGGADQKER